MKGERRIGAALERLASLLLGPKRTLALTLGVELVRVALHGSEADVDALVQAVLQVGA